LAGRLAEERTTMLLGLVRVLFSALLLKNSLGFARDLWDQGYFADFFFLPVVNPAWVPGKSLYALLLGVKIVAASCALVGVVPRAGLFTAASIGLYMLACDRLQYHNNRYATHLLCFLLAFAPCDRSFRLLPWRRPTPAQPSVGPTWAAQLARLQLSAIYLTSGAGKLLDDDWRGGRVMLQRFAYGADVLLARGYQLPGFVVEWVNSAPFGSLMSKSAIATELFLAFGLWHPATRVFALWLGVMFHLGIQASALVDLFSWLMLSAYILIATPELRERTFSYDPEQRVGRVLGAIVPHLDWLMRFQVIARPTLGAFEIRERDGNPALGRAAITALCRAIPILFPLWLPMAIASRYPLRGWTSRADRRSRASEPADTA
jgi:hypothetical protein